MEEKEITTPTKNEIIERAFAIHHHRNHNINSNNPELEELKESGAYDEAKRELMYSEKTQHLAYLEKQVNELGYEMIKENNIEGKQRMSSNFQIDIKEALRSGIFVCGGKGTTKTNLAMTIADKLMRKGIVVKVFDISRAWLKSSIPKIIEISYDTISRIGIYDSAVFDLSRLTPKIAKEFISKLLESEWNRQISIPEEDRKPIVYVFEEVQTLIPQGHLRSDEAQYILRLMTTGRNFDLGFLAITQRAALTDTSVFELSFQRYFSRMDGENDLKKVSSYIGNEKARRLQNLKLGEFFYDLGTETKLIKTEKFRSNTKPNLVPSTPFVRGLQDRKDTQQKTDWNSMLRNAQIVFQLIALLLFVATIFYALSM